MSRELTLDCIFIIIGLLIGVIGTVILIQIEPYSPKSADIIQLWILSIMIILIFLQFYWSKKQQIISEEKIIKNAFIRLNEYFNILLQPKDKRKAPIMALPYFRSHSDILLKIGIEVNDSPSRSDISHLRILDQYDLNMGTGMVLADLLQIVNPEANGLDEFKKIENKEEFKDIKLRMIRNANNLYNLNLSEDLAD